ncbi:MAG: pyridoxamine 5'-phosphate oxidase family protein [Firmicutes bacterium]|nr:pyridoxamine 5'-phosphate oxidase family protein [Bacillota bacterium]
MTEFRHMRLGENQTTKEYAEKMLKEASNGVLAIQTEDGFPITVPVNFVYKDNKILFHGANEGQKYELIQKEPRVSFCVVARDEIRPDLITSLFGSTIVIGKVHEITGDEKLDCVVSILNKYMPESLEAGMKYFKTSQDKMACYAIEIEHMTGKVGTP